MKRWAIVSRRRVSGALAAFICAQHAGARWWTRCSLLPGALVHNRPMESSGQHPPEPEVPLADAAIATEIAGAAARGRGADRSPTLEQLLAAFGEPAPTDAARRRVRAALRVSGMGSRPDLLEAEPGQRLLLLPPGAAKGPSRGRALAGLLVIGLVLVAAVVLAALLNSGDGSGDRASDALPDRTTTTATATAPTPVVGGSTTTTPTPTTDTTTQATTTTPAGDQAAAAAAARRQRRLRAKRRRERAAAALKAKQAAAARKRLVTVRVDATNRPTFLCVDDGSGHQLFGGTLSGKKTFRERRVRLNIGMASTRVTVNGTPVTLNGSPTGLDIPRRGGAQPLALGSRPCG